MGVLCGVDPGIKKLSELDIDVDKDWNAKGITNLKELADAMAKGDLPVRGNVVLVRLIPGGISLVLTSAGPGKIPVWLPCGGAFEYYFPVAIELTHAEQIVTVDQSHNENAPVATSHVQAYGDAPADMIKRLTPTIALPDAEAIVAANQTHNENSPLASECAIEFAVGGAKLEDGGAFTDYTTEINNVGANDVHLLPVCTNGGLVVGDAFYFGLDRPWDQLWLNIGQAGVGNYALAHEYWDGVAADWLALSGVIDNTSEFTVAGKHNTKWTRPGDWALTTVDALNLYWIRARVTAVVTYTTQPLGTQGWCEVLA